MNTTQHAGQRVEQYMVDEVAGVGISPPPVAGIVAQGRTARTRQRVRTWGGAALAAVVVAGVALGGANLVGGDGEAPVAGTASEGKVVTFDRFEATIPAIWSGSVVGCSDDLWVVRQDSPADACNGSQPLTLSFQRISAERIEELTGEPARPFVGEIGGLQHRGYRAECLREEDGTASSCSAGYSFDGWMVGVGTTDEALLPQAEEIARTITVVAESTVPAAEGQRVGLDGYTVEVPSAWDGAMATCAEGVSIVRVTEADPCGEDGAGADVTVTFMAVPPTQYEHLMGVEVGALTEETAGRRHTAPVVECADTTEGQRCFGYVAFEEMVVQAWGVEGVREQEIRDLVETVSALPEPIDD